MSLEAMAKVWGIRMPATIKIVVLAYADFANPKTHECYPSAKSVAEFANVDRSETWRIRQAMEQHDLLKKGAAGKTIFNIHWRPTKSELDAFVSDCRRERKDRLQTLLESKGVLGTPQRDVGNAPTLENVGNAPQDVGNAPQDVGNAPIEPKEPKEPKHGASAPRVDAIASADTGVKLDPIEHALERSAIAKHVKLLKAQARPEDGMALEIALAFCDATHIKPHSPKDAKSEMAAAREMQEAGCTVADMRRAIAKLRDGGMSITDLHSVKKTAVAIAANRIATTSSGHVFAPGSIFDADEREALNVA